MNPFRFFLRRDGFSFVRKLAIHLLHVAAPIAEFAAARVVVAGLGIEFVNFMIVGVVDDALDRLDPNLFPLAPPNLRNVEDVVLAHWWLLFIRHWNSWSRSRRRSGGRGRRGI